MARQRGQRRPAVFVAAVFFAVAVLAAEVRAGAFRAPVPVAVARDRGPVAPRPVDAVAEAPAFRAEVDLAVADDPARAPTVFFAAVVAFAAVAFAVPLVAFAAVAFAVVAFAVPLVAFAALAVVAAVAFAVPLVAFAALAVVAAVAFAVPLVAFAVAALAVVFGALAVVAFLTAVAFFGVALAVVTFLAIGAVAVVGRFAAVPARLAAAFDVAEPDRAVAAFLVVVVWPDAADREDVAFADVFRTGAAAVDPPTPAGARPVAGADRGRLVGLRTHPLNEVPGRNRGALALRIRTDSPVRGLR
ncbi:MAG: hypothetical protein ACRCXL_04375, partial [Dermatophilaceae bacterium]